MYTIIEMQTNDGQTICNAPQYAQTKDQAMSIYHGILAYAALSDVEYHACVVLDYSGRTVAKEYYTHELPDEDVPEETAEQEVIADA